MNSPLEGISDLIKDYGLIGTCSMQDENEICMQHFTSRNSAKEFHMGNPGMDWITLKYILEELWCQVVNDSTSI
jgi:hypothetical protein